MELWLALKLIQGNKKKILFPFMSVVVGIASLIITLGISTGGKYLIEKDLLVIGKNRVLLGGKNFQREDILLIESFPITEYAIFPEAKERIGDIIYIGYSENALKELNLKELNNNEIIIEKNQFPGVEIGDRLTLDIGNYKKNFRIKDLYEEKNPFELMKKERKIIISQGNFQRIFGEKVYSQIVISFDEKEDAEEYIPYIVQKLKASKGHYSKIEVLETPEVYKKIMKIKELVEKTLGIITFVSLAIGGFGIFNLIGNNIKNREKHIGMFRAFGMNISQIQKIFLLEGSLVGIIGGAIGVLIGYILCIIIGKILKIPPIFNIREIGLWIILSLVLGIVVGLFPVKKINEEKIVKVIQ